MIELRSTSRTPSRTGRWSRVAVAAAVVLATAGCGAGGGQKASGEGTGKERTTTTGAKGDVARSTTVPTSTTTDLTSTSTTAATSTTTTTKPTATTLPPPPDIARADLRAETYRVLCPAGSGPVEVNANGTPTPTPDGAVTVDIFEPTFADVTGDGRDDAVIWITCVFANGGNAFGASVVLVTNERDGLRQLGPPVDGYAPTVVGSTVAVARSVYSPEDPRCCPSTTRYVPLTFQSDHLAEGGGGARPLSESDIATTDGLGEFGVGRTYGEIAAALGQPVVVESILDVDSECRGVTIDGAPSDISGLGDPERLRSVQISNPAVRTKSGLGLGSTETQVYAELPGTVATPHDYVEGGHYLTFTAEEAPGRLAVFDTDGAKVTGYRVGEPGWANAVEGCL